MGGPRERTVLTIPNALSITRLLLVPFFVALWMHGEVFALCLLFPAALSDLLDGFLARRLHQRSELGALLDPVADKAFVLGALAAASWRRVVPAWFVLIICAREAMLAAGALLVVRRQLPRRMVFRPSRVGKWAQALLSASIVALAVDDLALGARHIASVTPALAAGAALAVIALVQYAMRAGELSHTERMRRQREREEDRPAT